MTIIGKAIDYSDARPDLSAVAAAGYTDVYRYTRTFDSAGKRLGPAERDQILDHGLDIGIHGEDQAGDAANGAARGTLRGTAWASYMHDTLGAPRGMTIVAAVDYDTLGQYPNAVDDYLGAVEAAFQGEYALGVYGSYYVVSGAHAAGRGGACYVMTNAWGPDTPSAFCHLHQHGGTPFPDTDHNDILRDQRGTWLQTLGGDMPLTTTDLDQVEARAVKAVREVLRISGTLNIIQSGQLVNDAALVILDREIDAIAALARAHGQGIASILGAETAEAAQITALAGAGTQQLGQLAAILTAVQSLQTGGLDTAAAAAQIADVLRQTLPGEVIAELLANLATPPTPP